MFLEASKIDIPYTSVCIVLFSRWNIWFLIAGGSWKGFLWFSRELARMVMGHTGCPHYPNARFLHVFLSNFLSLASASPSVRTANTKIKDAHSVNPWILICQKCASPVLELKEASIWYWQIQLLVSSFYNSSLYNGILVPWEPWEEPCLDERRDIAPTEGTHTKLAKLVPEAVYTSLNV